MSSVNPTSAWGKEFPFPHQSQGRLRAEFNKDQAICNACPRLSELDIIYCTIRFPFFHPQKLGNVLLCSALVSGWNSFPGLQVPLEGCGAWLCLRLTYTHTPRRLQGTLRVQNRSPGTVLSHSNCRNKIKTY